MDDQHLPAHLSLCSFKMTKAIKPDILKLPSRPLMTVQVPMFVLTSMYDYHALSTEPCLPHCLTQPMFIAASFTVCSTVSCTSVQ